MGLKRVGVQTPYLVKKIGLITLNTIISVIFCDNHKVTVHIWKLMSRGFQNTPNTCILLKYEGAMAFQNKAWFVVGISSKICAFWLDLKVQVKIFECKLLSSPWFNIENFSAYWIENFLNFSKLTQLLSLGQFLRPLEAFEPRRKFYCGGL